MFSHKPKQSGDGSETKSTVHLPQSPVQWVIFLGALLLLIAVIAFSVHQSTRGSADGAARQAEETGTKVSQEQEEPVVVCGEFSLDNTELNYYFWNEYFYLVGSYGDQLPQSLDPSRPLDEQAYDEEHTWYDVVLEQALATVRSTMSMVFEAEQAGFTLPEEYAASLENIQTALAESAEARGYTDENGEADVQAYLAASYGSGATVESFTEYLENSYLAKAYTDQLYAEPDFTEQEIAEYYDLYAQDYAANGIEKDDTALRTIRTVLIRPSADTDEAWAEAEASARTLYATWQAESGSEEDFAALAQTHSAAEEAADGGLQENLSPEELSGDLSAWVFDAQRQPGDTAVLCSDRGWEIVYYVGEGDGTVWEKTVEGDLRRETYQNAFRTICDSYSFLVNYGAVEIVTPDGLYDGSAGNAAESLQPGD